MCVITCCGGKRCCGFLTCCFPIRGCTYTFVFISFLLQLAMCIFFLCFEAWYAFVAIALTIVFHIYFIFVSRGQRFCLLHLFTTVESLWSLIYLLLFIWSIVLEIWPESWSPFWNYYFYDRGYEDWTAQEYTQSWAWILMIYSFICFVIQSYTSRLLFTYKKWLELQAVKNRINRHHSSHHAAPHVTVINTPVYTIQPPPQAPYQPPPPMPPPPPQPSVYAGPTAAAAMLPPPQPAQTLPTAPPVSPVPTPDNGRRMYPEVGPSSSSRNEAPPPYATAVGEDAEKGGAYQNYGYEQNVFNPPPPPSAGLQEQEIDDRKYSHESQVTPSAPPLPPVESARMPRSVADVSDLSGGSTHPISPHLEPPPTYEAATMGRNAGKRTGYGYEEDCE